MPTPSLIIILLSTCLSFTVTLFSCKNSTLNEQEKTVFNSKLKKQVGKMTATDIEKLIGIDIIEDTTAIYSGYYHYSRSETGREVLNGDFAFSYSDSGREFEYHFKKAITYSGQFYNGKPIKNFVEDALNDDGVDIYSRWRVTINYDSSGSKCKEALFIGQIGHTMPEATYRFKKLDTCSFEGVVSKAWKNWSDSL